MEPLDLSSLWPVIQPPHVLGRGKGHSYGTATAAAAAITTY